MSASSFISVMVDDEPLVKTAESDAVQVENSAYPVRSLSCVDVAHEFCARSIDWYFPTKDLQNRGRFEESQTHTTCGWKGTSSSFGGESIVLIATLPS
jgi:uncharacterized protein (DUF427 family)